MGNPKCPKCNKIILTRKILITIETEQDYADIQYKLSKTELKLKLDNNDRIFFTHKKAGQNGA